MDFKPLKQNATQRTLEIPKKSCFVKGMGSPVPQILKLQCGFSH